MTSSRTRTDVVDGSASTHCSFAQMFDCPIVPFLLHFHIAASLRSIEYMASRCRCLKYVGSLYWTHLVAVVDVLCHLVAP